MEQTTVERTEAVEGILGHRGPLSKPTYSDYRKNLVFRDNDYRDNRTFFVINDYRL
jgi:hypothetical protein